jgi:hypothetical protein
VRSDSGEGAVRAVLMNEPPDVDTYFPVAHGVQVEVPVELPNSPGGQTVQLEAEERNRGAKRTTNENMHREPQKQSSVDVLSHVPPWYASDDPLPHSRHVDCPISGWYVPTSHRAQDVWAGVPGEREQEEHTSMSADQTVNAWVRTTGALA